MNAKNRFEFACLCFALASLIAWVIVWLSGICVVAELIVIGLNKLGIDLAHLVVAFVVSFLISIIAFLLSEIFG